MMKKSFTRLFAVLTALILSLSMLASCASGSDNNVLTPPDGSSDEQPANAEPAVTSAPEDSDINETTASPAETEPKATTSETAGVTSASTDEVTTTAATTAIKVDSASGKMFAKSSVT